MLQALQLIQSAKDNIIAAATTAEQIVIWLPEAERNAIMVKHPILFGYEPPVELGVEIITVEPLDAE